MKQEEFLKSEESAVRHCPARATCPFDVMCGSQQNADEAPLFPYIFDVAPGELVWSDLRFEHRTFAIQSGIFECIANLERDDEKPFALFGRGYTSGLPELYVGRSVSQNYYLRALSAGRVCSFSSKALRHQLENLESSVSHRIISCALLNLSCASYAMSTILSQPLLYDRVSRMLVYLHGLKSCDDQKSGILNLGHAEIAGLVGADRAVITRTLHKMEEAQLVKLGYKSVSLLPAIFEAVPLESTAPVFHVANLENK